MEPTGTPKLSIVIVNYDSWDDVTRQVAQWTNSAAFVSGLIELIVVDNKSPTPPPLNRLQHNGLTWIDHCTNGGFAAGVNLGSRHAKSEWLLLANPDLDIGGTLAQEILELLERIDTGQIPIKIPKIGIIGIGLTNPDGTMQPSAGTFPTALRSLLELFLPRNRRRYQIVSPEKMSVVDWVTGAFFLVQAQTMHELNGFDTDYFLYFEETDFCYRARQKGWHTVVDPTLNVCHQKPLQNRQVSPMIRLWTRHSRLLFFKKNRPGLEFRIMLQMVRLEAILKYGLAFLGIGHFPKQVWKAIYDLTFAFAGNTQPVGEEARDWAAAALIARTSTTSDTDQV